MRVLTDRPRSVQSGATQAEECDERFGRRPPEARALAPARPQRRYDLCHRGRGGGAAPAGHARALPPPLRRHSRVPRGPPGAGVAVAAVGPSGFEGSAAVLAKSDAINVLTIGGTATRGSSCPAMRPCPFARRGGRLPARPRRRRPVPGSWTSALRALRGRAGQAVRGTGGGRARLPPFRRLQPLRLPEARGGRRLAGARPGGLGGDPGAHLPRRGGARPRPRARESFADGSRGPDTLALKLPGPRHFENEDLVCAGECAHGTSSSSAPPRGK